MRLGSATPRWLFSFENSRNPASKIRSRLPLELLGPALGAADREQLEEDEVPGHERHDDEQQYHELDDDARARDHREDREVLGHVHRNPSSFFRIDSGTATGL